MAIDATPPQTLTPITSAWGAQVSQDLNELMDGKADRTELTAGLAAQGLPQGGTTGQTLAKTSATDYAVGWTNNVVTVNAMTGAVVLRAPDVFTAPVAVKSTQPTAGDYGLTTLPVGAVWIQSA